LIQGIADCSVSVDDDNAKAIAGWYKGHQRGEFYHF
jgi:hypothetical protein